ncbi:MAG TPA: hypothetical protein VGC68_04460, partial [Enterovirga sp.]
ELSGRLLWADRSEDGASVRAHIAAPGTLFGGKLVLRLSSDDVSKLFEARPHGFEARRKPLVPIAGEVTKRGYVREDD